MTIICYFFFSTRKNILFKLGLLNPRFIINNSSHILDAISSSSLDLLALTETCVTSNHHNLFHYNICSPNYSVLHAHRQSGKRGGGIALILTNKISATCLNQIHTLLSKYYLPDSQLEPSLSTYPSSTDHLLALISSTNFPLF